MKLPNGANAVVEQAKLCAYALNPDHPVGGHKAALFRDLLGITLDNWQELRDALLHAARSEDVVQGRASRFGTKYEIRFDLTGPAGCKKVLAVWLVEQGDPHPRLITCYVE